MTDTIIGVKAPKDPVKKKPFFYIMRNQSIGATPMDGGSGVCYIYEDAGRLITSAKLVGSISDEDELELLKTTEGFRKLVHSIGIVIESSDRIGDVDFAFQMYGKNDIYGGGTYVKATVPANGMEIVINLEDIDWKEDDNEPGQIIFKFERGDAFADATVKLYLNDGFDAPVPEELYPVDTTSAEYKMMIEKSLLHKGNNYRIKKAIEKARNGKDTTLAFIGGSITQGAGAVPINTECYARKIFEGFCNIAGKGTDENIHYIKAGIGGTPSELGMIRYKSDVLDEGIPDVVVVEFAVNDGDDETEGVCYDSLVRKIYNGPGNPAVILLFAVFADDFNLQERLSPVGYSYNLPMVSTKDSVIEQFYQKYGEGRIVSKSQFFYDLFHPSNIGHTIMADGVINMLSIADASDIDKEINSLYDFNAPIGDEFENVERLDRRINECGAVINPGSFTEYDEELQEAEHNMNLHLTKLFTDNWLYLPGNDEDFKPFEMDIECKSLLIIFKDSASNKVGKADVYVDGVKTYYADPMVVGWTHCNAAIIYRSKETAKHHVEIKMAAGSEDKQFTILGFGVVV